VNISQPKLRSEKFDNDDDDDDDDDNNNNNNNNTKFCWMLSRNSGDLSRIMRRWIARIDYISFSRGMLLLHVGKKDFSILRWKKHGFQITFCWDCTHSSLYFRSHLAMPDITYRNSCCVVFLLQVQNLSSMFPVHHVLFTVWCTCRMEMWHCSISDWLTAA